MTATRRRFKRQESWRLKRVKENWRRPRGVTSRMRKEKNGWPSLVKVGRGSSSRTRGKHPKGLVERRVRNESDLEGLDPKMHIIRLARGLGERRRLILVDRAKSLNIHIANPGKAEARPVGEEQAEPEASTTPSPPLGSGEAPKDDSQIVSESEMVDAKAGTVEETLGEDRDK